MAAVAVAMAAVLMAAGHWSAQEGGKAGDAPAKAEAKAMELKTEVVNYTHEGDECIGTFYWTDGGSAPEGKRPGVMIVHAWKGPGQHEKDSAEKLAKLGYLAFVADMYGKNLRPQTPQEAGAAAGKFRSNRPLQRSRAAAGLATLKAHKLCDAANTAAFGYCFGGGTVLELARSGADTKAVISFHGNVDTPTPGDIKAFKGHVLVLHGADDPMVKDDAVAAMMKEMREAGVSWELVSYGDAVHSFSDPYAGSDKSRGAAYHKQAAARSWERTLDMLKEVFGK